MEFVRRTRATLRSAEFGFFGVVVYTRVHTPRRCGAATFFLRPFPDFKPGVASFFVFGLRPLRTSWDVVGIRREMVAADWKIPRGPTRPAAARLHSRHRSGTPRGSPWDTRAWPWPRRPRATLSSPAGLPRDGRRRAESRAALPLRRSTGSHGRSPSAIPASRPADTAPRRR